MTWSLRKSLGKSLAGAVVVGSASLVLAGCVIFVPTGPGEISSGDAPQPTVSADTVCRGGESELDQSETTYTMIAGCDLITVTGNDITVVAPDVERIEVRGDRAMLTVGNLDSLLVSGNDSTISAFEIDTLEITGDRATIDATGLIGRAIVNGNENNVLSGMAVEGISDSGERNSFAP